MWSCVKKYMYMLTKDLSFDDHYLTGDGNQYAECVDWFRTRWMCICMWVIKLLRQNVMWTCFICSSVTPK